MLVFIIFLLFLAFIAYMLSDKLGNSFLVFVALSACAFLSIGGTLMFGGKVEMPFGSIVVMLVVMSLAYGYGVDLSSRFGRKFFCFPAMAYTYFSIGYILGLCIGIVTPDSISTASVGGIIGFGFGVWLTNENDFSII